MKLFFLIILSVLFFPAVGQNLPVKPGKPLFSAAEKEAFKKDKFGCGGKRTGFHNHFLKNENIILLMTVAEVLETFGEPDEKRNDCWLYFLYSHNSRCLTKVESEVIEDSFLKLCFEEGRVVKVSLDEEFR